LRLIDADVQSLGQRFIRGSAFTQNGGKARVLAPQSEE
jgi:hypothetical protein